MTKTMGSQILSVYIPEGYFPEASTRKRLISTADGLFLAVQHKFAGGDIEESREPITEEAAREWWAASGLLGDIYG